MSSKGVASFNWILTHSDKQSLTVYECSVMLDGNDDVVVSSMKHGTAAVEWVAASTTLPP